MRAGGLRLWRRGPVACVDGRCGLRIGWKLGLLRLELLRLKLLRRELLRLLGLDLLALWLPA